MNPSTDQARYLASSLQDVAEGLSPDDLDGLLRVLDLGDRLGRMGSEALSEPELAALVVLAAQARPSLLRRIHELLPAGWEWPPLDQVGDSLLLGEQPEDTIAWGMALLRLANLLPELEPEPRLGARQVLQRAQDRLQLDPRAFLDLVSLAAQRVEDEPLAAQPAPVRALLGGMLELPILLAEERRPARNHRVEPARPPERRTAALNWPLRRRPIELRADSLAVPPPDAWRTVWEGQRFTLSLAELVAGEGSAVLLSVVGAAGAPSLERRDAVQLQELDGSAISPDVRLYQPDEWQALVPGDRPLTVVLPDGQEVDLHFERPQ